MSKSSDDKKRDEVLKRMLQTKPTPQKKLKEELKTRRDAGEGPSRGRPKG
jgi:hypothetical protein